MPEKCRRNFAKSCRLTGMIIFITLALALPRPALATNACEYIAWLNAGALATGRGYHTATLLPNGKVLVAGGQNDTGYLASCELYDPATGTWSPAGPAPLNGSLTVARSSHTATLLPNGKVLVAGGDGDAGPLASCELYDPATGTWSPAGPGPANGALNVARNGHTATRLLNGKVLVTGGGVGSTATDSCELYDPATGSWSTVRQLFYARAVHTATLLPPTVSYPQGRVLVTGGSNNSGPMTQTELYDPATDTWAIAGDLRESRYRQTATLLPNGQVLVAGGYYVDYDTYTVLGRQSAELYNPATGSWTLTITSLSVRRAEHTATLLPNGQVVVAGGFGGDNLIACTEIYNPDTDIWQPLGALNAARVAHTATLLPSGKVLVASGGGTEAYLTSAEVYDYAAGSWADAAGLNLTRSWHTATLLNNGQVLVAGGSVSSYPSNTCALYVPSFDSWDYPSATLNEARLEHTATLLANGKVLVAGGHYGADDQKNTAELYDGAVWSYTAGSLHEGRTGHTATLLGDGRVLAVGGIGAGNNRLASAEIFDPNATSNSWTSTNDMAAARVYHTATLLPNGKVLVVGGVGNVYTLGSVEIYNPATGEWSPGASLPTPRQDHTATLLPSGKVLVAGGYYWDGFNDYFLTSTLIYDPATDSWTATGNLFSTRYLHKATLLANGKVLVAGGSTSPGEGASAELYDPATGVWTDASGSFVDRYGHTATLLANGKVLEVAGYGQYALAGVQLYDPGLGFQTAWRPQLSTVTTPLASGQRLYLTGSGFKGLSGASGGATNDSPTDYPLVQLRRLDSERVLWVPPNGGNPAAFSATSFESGLLQDFQTGHCLVTVFANGIPCVSHLTVFNNTGPPTAVKLKSFTATGAAGYVQLNWQTGSEINTVAFRLWRREGTQGDYKPNQALIPSKGSPSMGAKYSYKDSAVVKGHTYYYKLEDLARDGTSTFHGPVSATVGPVKKARLGTAPATEPAPATETVPGTEPAPAPAPVSPRWTR